jgi:hypothetical protein
MNAQSTPTSGVDRTVRFVDVSASDISAVQNGIEDLYNDTLDVIIVRNAFPREPLARAGERLDREDQQRAWARPNEKMPVEDIQLLGTDTPATPTYQAPRGASLDSYLESAKRHRSSVEGVFDPGFDPDEAIHETLARFSGGRPVEAATTATGDPYVPFTLRRLVHGKQIGLHHDYHYPLALYSELVPRVDTGTLVSYVTTLRRPAAGGELCVYAVTPTTPNAPKMPNGFSWDLDAIEQRFDSAKFTMDVGDFFLLASGRCLHRIAPIDGPVARVTMGGFLALDKDRRRVLYWS